MNFCVQEILKQVSELLRQLCELFIAIRASPQRIQKFKKVFADFKMNGSNYEEVELAASVEEMVIPNDLLPILDCPTR
jgi:hypothetical protein